MPTKRVVLAATTASALAATGAGAFAFAPPPASAAAGRRAAIARRPMSSVDEDVPVRDASWSIGDPAEHRLEAERKRDAAKVNSNTADCSFAWPWSHPRRTRPWP